jgi:plasmid stability protein
MGRLTISLPDDLHRELRIRAASAGEPIGRLIERAVEDQKELARRRAMELLERAWANAAAAEPQLTEEELMDLAVEETHAVRKELARKRSAKVG